MKITSVSARVASLTAAIALQSLPAGAITFANDTAITPLDTNYDGADLVVTNCILTVDGPHSFASVQIQNGGALTHSPATNGILPIQYTVSGEVHVLNLTNADPLLYSNAVSGTIVVQDALRIVTYTNGADYQVFETNNFSFIQLLPGSAIPDGSTNLVDYQYLPNIPSGLNLTVAGDLLILPGGAINADFKGYGPGLGAGAGNSSGSPASGSGASHGGNGGLNAGLSPASLAYDAIQQPADKGSGGGSGYAGPGGAGGGALSLVVGGTLRNDGLISANGANGTNGRSGGGAGGSVWLTTHNLAGSGSIFANGGKGEPSTGGGGAGGRIALLYGLYNFTGQILARGASGYAAGGAGTIYTKTDTQTAGQVLVDNGGLSGYTTLPPTAEAFDLAIQNGATVIPPASQTVGNLLLTSNAWLAMQSQTLTATGDATIQTGGGIIADGAGYGVNQGSGAGRYTYYGAFYIGGGGSYGGFGAPPSSGIYGLLASPTSLGSGGGSYYTIGVGGMGGGAVRLDVTGTLVLNGAISANGSPGLGDGTGGGSGGSVWISVGTLAGAGRVSAHGGAGNGSGLYAGGGGGGGRIAVQYTANLFFGSMTARGGSGSSIGGAGTIYAKANNQSFGQLSVDNGGQFGSSTSWPSGSTSDLTISGGAVVLLPSSQYIGTLLITSNAWMVISNQTSPITISGNATVQAGGGIIADGTGYPGSQGSGAGRTYGSQGYGGGGGGYGGYGANGGSISATGGTAYGSLASPSEFGSGGGGYLNSGGYGGGSVRLAVTGVLDLNGTISANGASSTSLGGGGGSGGTVSLTVGTLSGFGVISANGGAGNGLGGGGGGGRIAIQYSVNSFSGRITASGGGGSAWGGAGTVFTRPNYQSAGQVTLDNAGQPGANTPLSSYWVTSSDLTIRSGANATLSGTVGNLVVGSGGWLSLTNQLMTVAGNATIQFGGAILADGAGYSGGSGTGAGRSGYYGNTYVGGGGSYGGFGGNGFASSAAGGSTYGSATSPVDMGSGGGGTSSPVGGAGGGVIRLNVTGLLQIDGRLSANGNSATNSGAGGGSGGAISLSAGTFAGSGSISANGGQGYDNLGGGGGGGRIAITYGSSSFSGSISALGASGYAWGGAGTIFTKANSQSFGQLVIDNGGIPSAGTPLPSIGIVDITVRGSALLYVSTSQTIGNLLLASNAWLVVSNQPTITVTANAIVQSGSGIIADGTSSTGGTGAGRNYYSSTNGYVGGGGGYGGYGGTAAGASSLLGGNAFGSVTTPTDYGSAGGGYSTGTSPGGGAIRLNVTGTLLLDGRISANGASSTNSVNGGGSGGSVLLSVGTLSGAGTISANGGAGGDNLGGGGGGGRISVQYSSYAFSGRLSAFGGGGYAAGGAGTIYTKASSQSTGQILVDNGGPLGTNTTLTGASGPYDLTIKGGAVVTPPSASIGNLMVSSNGWLQFGAKGPGLTVTGNANVQTGGGIIADGAGGAGGQGAGSYVSTPSGFVGKGGSYGGYGSAGAASFPSGGGGIPYGSMTAPTSSGSSGGSFSSAYGGSGGGIILLNVIGLLVADGRISADGLSGLVPGSGGGSGGSVSLTVGTLSGSGVISANGGAGNGLGGGGGGGRIALLYGANTFSGRVCACGGSGATTSAGAGTIYTKANSQAMGRILVDNGGAPGTNTPIAYLSAPFDLTIRNGAVASPSGSSLLLSNLLVETGGSFASLQLVTSLDLAVYRNATVETNAVFTLDGRGFLAGSGPGAGVSSSSIGSGAGYGGPGGASSLSPGGATYGSSQQPRDLGSGGGFGYGAPAGSQGGGAVYLRVGGDLTINGQLTANGNAALQDGAGGGSGGSLWLSAGALAGTGLIAANGGDGEPYLGGGGGGGRIAIYTPYNLFRGTVSALGGNGFLPGQTGSIYSSASLAPLLVTSQSPAGSITNAVSAIDLTFNTELLGQTVLASDALLTTPAGVESNITAALTSPTSLRLTFPSQTTEGPYTFTFGPHLQDIYGIPISQVYTGAFTIVWPVISGTITDTNNQPVPNVLIQPDGGIASTNTDTNGNYALKVTPGADVTITPFLTNLVFVPGSRAYTAVAASISSQDYLAVASIIPTLSGQRQVSSQATNMAMNWYGLSGVTYQALYSTNLVDWQPYSDPVAGTNGPLQLLMPLDNSPMMFFRLSAGD